MDYRRLAGTDLDVSTLCFGPMRAASKEGHNNDHSKAGARALDTALASGVNFLHSSYEYGTRWMMTDVLKKHPKRHDIHHIIKLPVPDWDDNGVFNEAKFRTRVEDALRELSAERIAVLQWMWRFRPNEDKHILPLLANIMDDVQAAFEKLRDEGKAGFMMAMPYTVYAGAAAMEPGHLSGMVSFLNPIEMEMVELFEDMERNNQGYLCIRPLYQSILTDNRTSWSEVPEGHYLERLQRENPEAFNQRAAIADVFSDEINNTNNGSMTRFALRFPLASPLVASVITGLNTEAQVLEAVETLDNVAPNPELFKTAHELWKADFKT